MSGRGAAGTLLRDPPELSEDGAVCSQATGGADRGTRPQGEELQGYTGLSFFREGDCILPCMTFYPLALAGAREIGCTGIRRE